MEIFAQAYADTTTNAAAGSFVFMMILILWLVMIISFWKVFEKAGEAGWKSIIPFYNMWVLFEIAGRPGWWLFLMFIPFVNFVISIILALDLAKVFGKSPVFGIFGLWLFSFVGYLIIGWGDAEYHKPEVAE